MTERVEHTAGPWKRSDYGQIVGVNGMNVCFRSVTTICSGSEESIAEAEANTDLIAAAPDLLAFAIAVSDADNEGHMIPKWMVRDARAAIAAATGEA